MKKLSSFTIGILLREYEAGMEVRALAAKYRVSVASIYPLLHKYGVKLRSHKKVAQPNTPPKQTISTPEPKEKPQCPDCKSTQLRSKGILWLCNKCGRRFRKDGRYPARRQFAKRHKTTSKQIMIPAPGSVVYLSNNPPERKQATIWQRIKYVLDL